MIKVNVMRVNKDTYEHFRWGTWEFKTEEEANAFIAGVAAGSGSETSYGEIAKEAQ